MAQTGYVNYGSVQSNVPAELMVYYEVTNRTANDVTIKIDVEVHYTSQWSTNGCWVDVNGNARSCNPNRVSEKYYWYASSQSNVRSGYWQEITFSAPAQITAVSLVVGFSNTKWAVDTFQYHTFTLLIPIGNTNAYWVNPACNVDPSGIIGEDTSTLNVSWSGARDDQGNTILYRTEIWKNGAFTGQYVGGDSTTGTSGTYSISEDSQGTSYYFRTYCKDEDSSTWVFGKQSVTVTKNKFTIPTSFVIDSSTIVPKATYKITCTHNLPTNSNGNTSFKYGLTAQFVNSLGTAYNLAIYGATNTTVAPATFNVTMWDGKGVTPTGIYIKQSDIKAACASYATNSYKGSLRLNMTCLNEYGSLGTVSADKTLNWQYTPLAPTVPKYSTTSYFTLPNISGPVFVINKRAITWSWGKVIDPNGTTVSYEVYTKTDVGTWVLTATTIATSYDTEIISLSKSQTYQIKVVAVFSYGTTSGIDSSIGAQIVLHYYNSPILSEVLLGRTQTEATIRTTITPSTSISNSIGAISIQYSGLVSSSTTTTAPPYKSTFQDSKKFVSLVETSSGDINVSYTDSVMSVILGSTKATTSVVVPPWSALFTIREKGIGINAIAGDFADFIVNGSTSLYGGDTNGDINLSSNVTSGINFYSGLYVDSDGKLRAAQDIERNSKMYQMQFSPGSSVLPPLRWRYMLCDTLVYKDGVYTPTAISDWYNIANSSYPIGSIYISYTSTNPSGIFTGTTWILDSVGRAVVGVDTTQTEFNAVGKTGGAKTHTLTVAELPKLNFANAELAWRGAMEPPQGGTQYWLFNYSNKIMGQGQSHNNLQPYQTFYIWRRTA